MSTGGGAFSPQQHGGDDRMAGARERSRAVVHDAWRRAVRRRRLERLVGGTCALILGATAFLVVSRAWDPPPTEVDPLLREVVDRFGSVSLERAADGVGHRVTTGEGSGIRLAMTDGADLRVDAESRLRVGAPAPRGDDEPSRSAIRLEEGAFYFRSAGPHRHATPVETPLARLVNLGTAYEARLFPGDEPRLEVAVRSGRVRVTTGDGANHTVEAGQLLVVRSGRGLEVALSTLDPASERFDWTHRLTRPFAIDGRTVEDFLRWVANEQGIDVVWQVPPRDRALRLHGEVIWRDPQAALEPTLRLVGLTGTLGESSVVVKER